MVHQTPYFRTIQLPPLLIFPQIHETYFLFQLFIQFSSETVFSSLTGCAFQIRAIHYMKKVFHHAFPVSFANHLKSVPSGYWTQTLGKKNLILSFVIEFCSKFSLLAWRRTTQLVTIFHSPVILRSWGHSSKSFQHARQSQTHLKTYDLSQCTSCG